MRQRSPLRFIVYIAYLGVLFAFGGLAYERLTRFDGHIYIAEGGFERVVVQPAGEGGPFLGSHRNMPLEVIPFSNPRAPVRVFPNDTLYDAQILPFTLQLHEIGLIETFPERHILEVSTPATTVIHELAVGATIEIAGDPFEVAAIRPWAGLLRNPKGSPMASVSLHDPERGWGREFLLTVDTWTFPDPDTFFLLRWHDSEETARAEARILPAALANGRWGVRDGARVHWSTSFLPGNGFTLENGAEVTLVAHDPEIPAIAVEIRLGDAIELVRCRANQGEDDSTPLRFDAPRLAKTAYVLHAWRDAMALFQRVADDGDEGHVLKEGESWRPGGDGLPVRLDQVMAGALPVSPGNYEGEPVLEAVLQADGAVVQLREGMRIPHDHAQLRYRREPVPALVRYTLSARNRDGAVGRITLAPEETRRLGGWLFRQDARFANNQTGALLHARRTLGTPAQQLGMGMVVVGAFGWVVLRFLPRRASPVRAGRAAEFPGKPRAD